MNYNYDSDTMTTATGNTLPLEPYRLWLLSHNEPLVSGHFVKAIATGRGTKFTYDWQAIFFAAEEYNFLNEYLKTINHE